MLLHKEQGMAFARATAAGFDLQNMEHLLVFADCFGATRLGYSLSFDLIVSPIVEVTPFLKTKMVCIAATGCGQKRKIRSVCKVLVRKAKVRESLSFKSERNFATD